MQKLVAVLSIFFLFYGCASQDISEDVENQATKDKEMQQPEKSELKEGPIGYLGCSNTIQTVQGYYLVGGKKIWKPDMRYDSGSVAQWVDGIKNENRFWKAFDDNLRENPGTNAIWWELCIPEEQLVSYENAVLVLDAIRKRIPEVVIYVSGLPEYTDGICRITGTAGIKRGLELVKELSSGNNDVLPGPALGPMTPEYTDDYGCHLAFEGKKALGKQMAMFFGEQPIDPDVEEKEDDPELEDNVWRQRIEAALARTDCPSAQKQEFPDSYYQGPLIDTHLHIPAIPDWSPEDEKKAMEDTPEGRFGGQQALLGWNVKMSEITCNLKHEGTMKNFAFFPVYEEIPLQLLEIWNRTMEKYPDVFTPFIMPPGPHDVTPTIDGEKLKEALEWFPIFKGYGEIGLYEIEGVRKDFPPDSKIFQDIYTTVRNNKLAVYMHPGEGHKDNFEKVLKENPDINFIVHGDEIQGDITSLMDKYPNIYYGVDAFWGDDMDLFRLFVGKSKKSYLEAMEKEFDDVLDYEIRKWKPVIEKHPDKFLWGTDRGDAVWNYDLEIGQIMVKFARAFIGKLDTTVQDKIAHKNAEGLL